MERNEIHSSMPFLLKQISAAKFEASEQFTEFRVATVSSRNGVDDLHCRNGLRASNRC